jgi:hypothetical protein
MFLRLLQGDCLDRLLELEDESVDIFVGDPPYDLTAKAGQTSSKGGFMGKTWDATGIAFDPDFWRLVARKLKPGGRIKSFGGTRTYHRMVRAMRRAGLLVERLHAWCYASGFPKSTNISKQIDRMAKVKRTVIGYKRGVGGESMNDLVHGRAEVKFAKKAGGSLGAYGTGAKQIAVMVPITAPATQEAIIWDGYGTALKPAIEPIVIARKIA